MELHLSCTSLSLLSKYRNMVTITFWVLMSVVSSNAMLNKLLPTLPKLASCKVGRGNSGRNLQISGSFVNSH
jgi:hypothetical protein